MLTRAISGAVFVSILVFAILFNANAFLALFFIFMLISIFEFSKMLEIKGIEPYLLSISIFCSSIFPNWELSTIYTDTLSVLIVLIVFIKHLFDKKSDAIKELGNFLLCIVYTCISYIFIVKIPYTNQTNNYDSVLILGVFILIWSNDTFAYLTGVTIGKTKLLERVSPKKTIEGFIGGVLATMIISFLISFKFTILLPYQWIILGVLTSIFGVVGDLIASMFKRQTGVKDTGNIIPGHGGIIDRLDSIIFVAPFIYLYLKFIT
ncbi:phosphatidate cytidylyltransferase [Flavicella sp.]|uniref:phosphatidate cytidylyltransferase n=1 Tax=Flavicella sp. TaxID=2957742 RepID=UPI0030161EF8